MRPQKMGTPALKAVDRSCRGDMQTTGWTENHGGSVPRMQARWNWTEVELERNVDTLRSSQLQMFGLRIFWWPSMRRGIILRKCQGQHRPGIFHSRVEYGGTDLFLFRLGPTSTSPMSPRGTAPMARASPTRATMVSLRTALSAWSARWVRGPPEMLRGTCTASTMKSWGRLDV